ncbi:MAG: carbon-nitrogen family hydrolase [Clostridiales bacterium]|nr:carbon-nitrogen family hydrolase [Clostridiales bacterium]
MEIFMRTGLAQMNIVWENIQSNMVKVEEFFDKASENQVELLVFPEMSLAGFSMNVAEITKDWQRQIEFFEDMSRTYQMTVVYGYPAPIEAEEREQHPEWKGYKNWLAVAEDGRTIMRYAKIHPFTFGSEGKYYQGGQEVVCTRWKDTVLGGFVCYDLRFPEIFQISSARSEIIAVIANWPASRISQWDALLQARAIENQCYILGVNRTGEGDGIFYNGHSALYDPLGERMTVLCEEESLLIGDIDVKQVAHFRSRLPVKKDRKEELYKKLSLHFV